MRNGKITIYSVNEPIYKNSERKCVVTLNDGTNLTVNACCTGVSWSKSGGKNKVTIEYEPTELEIKDITSEVFYAMLEDLNNHQADEEELDEFDYDETKDILFRKFEEMSKMKFYSEENYIECCKAMDSIAMTLLETE